MGVVIIVPALTAGEQRNPPAAARVVAGFKAAAAPEVSGGAYQPGGVQAQGHSEEDSPEDHTECVSPSSPNPPAGKQQHSASGDGKPMVFAEPNVEPVAIEIGAVALEDVGFRVKRFAEQYPAGMCPPSALPRRVRLAFVIAELVMDSMC